MAVFTTGGRKREMVNYVNYIQSSGTQYIDSGFTPNQDTRVAIDVDLTGTVDGYAGFAVARNDSTFFAIFHNESSGLPYDQYNGTTLQTGNANLLGRHTIDKNKNITYVDGVAINAFTYASFTCPCDLRLFADKQPSSAVKHFAVGKLYSCQIYDNGTLVRDFWPCLDPDGVACLYDKVTKEYYYNAGSGEFTAG